MSDSKNLESRIASLETRLALVERVPSLRHELQMLGIDDRRRALERGEALAEKEKRAAYAEKRLEFFGVFVKERLEFLDGYRSQPGEIWAAYTQWSDEQELTPNEKYTEGELLAKVESLPGVTIGEVRSHLGGRLEGLHGVQLRLEFQTEKSAFGDKGLIDAARRKQGLEPEPTGSVFGGLPTLP